MSDYPQDLRYSADHEWARPDGDRVRVGITSYAQEALGDIVFVSLPEVGSQVEVGSECGEIESTKSVSPLVSPVGGVVAAVNTELDDAPELVNTDPYGAGWMIEVTVGGSADLEALMSAEEYAAQLG
jgi:glycine cleavage system H protein